MKKTLSFILALFTSMLFTLQAAAAGATAPMGDSGPWLYVALAVVAVVLVVVLVVTGKRR